MLAIFNVFYVIYLGFLRIRKHIFVIFIILNKLKLLSNSSTLVHLCPIHYFRNFCNFVTYHHLQNHKSQKCFVDKYKTKWHKHNTQTDKINRLEKFKFNDYESMFIVYFEILSFCKILYFSMTELKIWWYRNERHFWKYEDFPLWEKYVFF